MFDWNQFPGRIYVLATALPLLCFVLLSITGMIRFLRHRPNPGKMGAYFSVLVMGISTVLSFIGLSLFLRDVDELGKGSEEFKQRWAESIDWVRIIPKTLNEETVSPATSLQVGYHIDHLTVLMFSMVCFISTCIFLFSLGYMKDEAKEQTTDHDLHHARRGRYGRFFLFLSLFCFSMLHLLIAENLFQIFVSWELVGLCSFFLIGFYYERPSAGLAANKAFIVNRVGDAGFLIGIAILWTYFGTLNIDQITSQIRCPAADIHEDSSPVDLIDTFLRADRSETRPNRMDITEQGEYLLIFPGHWHAADLKKQSVLARVPPKSDSDFQLMPYYLFVIAGIGIFLGCVGKSAQFPLHTWLPDAMEGPTPVSALIHAATMVAAGVYLVGRCFPLFAPEVLLTIAYTGAITLFLAATIALVMNDIKRVLAYSTVSQLGYMMLALGVGGWVAGLLHLLTHAFFKALLFLSAGSVIHGCHHEQDLRKMGGLLRKMPITAITMLIGVLAIIGTPLFSGWYSKDRILSVCFGYTSIHKEHLILFVLPLVTAVLTAFYMFRLWFLTFTGSPRDSEMHSHVHESPWVMTLPLILLAILSVCVAWGWPIWDAEQSLLGDQLHAAQPSAVAQEFGSEIRAAEEHHSEAGQLALGAAVLGVVLAILFYGLPRFSPAKLARRTRPVHLFLSRKWYFDELYHVVVVGPTLILGRFACRFDKKQVPTEEAVKADREMDPRSVDGVLNAIGLSIFAIGQRVRAFQTGLVRRYVFVLVLTAVVIFAILSVLTI